MTFLVGDRPNLKPGLRLVPQPGFFVETNPSSPKPAPMVPRIIDITGSQSADEIRAQREWERKKAEYRAAQQQNGGYGSPTSKAAWQRLTRRNRSA